MLLNRLLITKSIDGQRHSSGSGQGSTGVTLLIQQHINAVVPTPQKIYFVYTYFSAISLSLTSTLCKIQPVSESLTSTPVYFGKGNNLTIFLLMPFTIHSASTSSKLLLFLHMKFHSNPFHLYHWLKPSI